LNSSAPGCCNIWQVLVELVMVNGSAGQAVVLQHMAKTHGNRLLQPLQQAVRLAVTMCHVFMRLPATHMQ
jgi:hypothetical protein